MQTVRFCMVMKLGNASLNERNKKCFSNWYGRKECLLFCFSEIKKYLATVVYFGGVLWVLKKQQRVPHLFIQEQSF